jgi:hypothetical protein
MSRWKYLVAILATAAFSLIGVASASATTAGHHPHIRFDPTLACTLTAPACNEPVEAQSPAGQLFNFNPTADAAFTVASFPFVSINPFNALDNGQQDFDANLMDVVPTIGVGGYNWTPFDNFHYHGDPVYEEEWAPGGFDTGFCLQVTGLLHQIKLSPCDGGADQAFIVTRLVPNLFPPASPIYTYALSALQNISTAHHACLTGTPGGVVGIVTTSRCVRHSPGVASDQMFSAIP